MWLSWPQACMTPTSCPLYSVRTLDAKGRSTISVTGRASMSERNATVGPGRPPRSSPTTPVWAIPVRTSIPRLFRCSAILAEVRNSRLLSSGF